MLKVITLSTNQSNRQKPMVDATISRIYLMDEWPFHCICIWLVKWSKSRKTVKKGDGDVCFFLGRHAKTHFWPSLHWEMHVTESSPAWISVPWEHHSPVIVTLPDCTDLPLSRAYFGYCPAPHRVAGTAPALALGQPPQVYTNSMVICKCSQALNQYDVFMQGEERGKRPIMSDIWKLHTLSLFPLLYQTLAVKTPVENTGKWKDFYNTNELSIRPKEQGYVVVCLFQFSNVHRGRLSNPVIHIK